MSFGNIIRIVFLTITLLSLCTAALSSSSSLATTTANEDEKTTHQESRRLLRAATTTTGHRRLEEEEEEEGNSGGGIIGSFAFLVSNIDTAEENTWCIAAPPANSSSRFLTFAICDFEGQPVEQLWEYNEENMTFESFMDVDLCITVRNPQNNRRAQVDTCGDSGSQSFMYNATGTASPMILIYGDEGDEEQLCLTNQGASPNVTDPIRAQECEDSGRFFFTFQLADDDSTEDGDLIEPETDVPTAETETQSPTEETETDAPTEETETQAPTEETETETPTATPIEETETEPPSETEAGTDATTNMPSPTMTELMGYVGFINDDSDGGCLVVEDEEPEDGQSLILGECDEDNHDWLYEEETGLFRTALADGMMCMQVGHDSADVEDGVRMRLYTCDPLFDRQIFDYNGSEFRLRSGEGGELCLGYSGNTGDVGDDDLIMKSCENPGVTWSWEM